MNEFEFGDLTEEQLDYITEKDPEKLKELDKPFVSKGFNLGFFIKVKPLKKYGFYKTKHEWDN